MTGADLRTGREQKGWTQEESASRLGVSQPYLSLLEKGARRVHAKLARKAATAYGLSAATLPVETDLKTLELKNEKSLARPGGSRIPRLFTSSARTQKEPNGSPAIGPECPRT